MDSTQIMCFVSGDGDHCGRDVGLARLSNDVARIRQISHAIEHGNAVFTSWATRTGGSVVEAGGDEFTVQVPAAALADLEALRQTYQTAVQTSVSVGVGKTVEQSAKALLIAKARGKDRVVLYDKSVEEEFAALRPPTDQQKLYDEYLKKAELVKGDEEPNHRGFGGHIKPVATSEDHSAGEQAEKDAGLPLLHPDRPPDPQELESNFRAAADAQDRQDRASIARKSGDLAQLREQVASALQGIRQQLPQLTQLKQAAPDTFKAVTGLVQAVIAMGREVQAADDQLAKAEAPARIWRGGGVSIPGRNSPLRGTYDKRYHAAVAHAFTYGDSKALRPRIIKLADIKGTPNPVHAEARLKLYTRMLAGGDEVPPVVVSAHPSGGWVVRDGAHRVAAAQAAGADSLPALEVRKSEVGAQDVAKAADLEAEELDPTEGPPGDGELDKEEAPAVSIHHNLNLPVGSTHNGQILVQHSDGKKSWKGVKAGMISSADPDSPNGGPNSHPTSSREPGAP